MGIFGFTNMANYQLYYNDVYIKNINLPSYNINDWVIAYSNQNGINWYNTQTKNNDVIVSDITSDKNFKLIYNGK